MDFIPGSFIQTGSGRSFVLTLKLDERVPRPTQEGARANVNLAASCPTLMKKAEAYGRGGRDQPIPISSAPAYLHRWQCSVD